MVGKIRSWVEAPKWANVSNFIKNLAWELGLECTVEVDKGWIRETVRYVVEGEEAKLRTFKDKLLSTARAYNN